MNKVATSPDGVKIYFEVHGRGSPALVFVHGWSCDRTYWARQIECFATRFRVVAIDLAGHGESGVDRRSWTIPAFGGDVVAVVEKLRLRKVILIGHSMGGSVILEAAVRLRTQVIGVVWVDVYRSLQADSDEAKSSGWIESFRQDFVAATTKMARKMFTSASDPQLVEEVVADMCSAPAELATKALSHAVRNRAAAVEALGKLTVPVVSINPDYRHTDIEGLARHGIRTVILNGVGHFPMLEDPSGFNRVLQLSLKRLG